MKVLCVGAGGYLGIPLSEELARRNYEVHAIDRYFFGRRPTVPVVRRGDIRNITVDQLREYYAVVDLAGLSNDAAADIDPALTISVNVHGGKQLAQRAREAGVKRYVYSSSCSVYGHNATKNLDESAPLRPLTHYAQSKVKVEEELCRLASNNFKVVILRNGTVFGVSPRMRFDLAVNVMTLRAWQDNIIYVMGGGEQFRPFVHVRDVVAAFVKALEADADKCGTFNVVAENMTIKALATEVQKLMPTAHIHNIPDDPDKRSYHVSSTRIKRLWDWKPNFYVHSGIVSVRDALRSGEIDGDDPTTRTVQWYKSLMEWDARLHEIRLDGRIL